MKEYRAQLDADRAKRLSKGTNHADLRVKADDMKSKVSDPLLSIRCMPQPRSATFQSHPLRERL